jgi:hypothetical protein
MIILSPDDQERIRQPPPLPFVNWSRTQRLFLGWGCLVAWICLVGAVGVSLLASFQLPVCTDSRFVHFSFDCRTTGGVALLVLALGELIHLYYQFMILISQIVYFPPYPNYYED